MKIYLAATAKENDKYYSYIIPVKENQNILAVLKAHKNIITADVCKTKKRAAEIITAWNEQHKKNGVYMFDDAPQF